MGGRIAVLAARVGVTAEARGYLVCLGPACLSVRSRDLLGTREVRPLVMMNFANTFSVLCHSTAASEVQFVHSVWKVVLECYLFISTIDTATLELFFYVSMRELTVLADGSSI